MAVQHARAFLSPKGWDDLFEAAIRRRYDRKHCLYTFTGKGKERHGGIMIGITVRGLYTTYVKEISTGCGINEAWHTSRAVMTLQVAWWH